jgi:uncharacterized protein
LWSLVDPIADLIDPAARATIFFSKRNSENVMSKSIVIANVAATELQPAPITRGWILSGAPDACNRMLASSRDKLAHTMVWECTPGIFNWHYDEAETAVILSGEVFLTYENGRERRLGPGDMVFFPAGSSCHWRITSKVRKVAVLHKILPFPLALGVRIWNKYSRIMGSPIRAIKLNPEKQSSRHLPAPSSKSAVAVKAVSNPQKARSPQLSSNSSAQ